MSTKEINRRIATMEANIRRLRDQLTEHAASENVLFDRIRAALATMGISWDVLVNSGRLLQRLFYARCVVSIELRDAGYTMNEIGEILNRNHATISYYIRRYNEVKDDPRRDRNLYVFITEFEDRLK